MAWKSMLRRCYNPAPQDITVYNNINVCQTWRDDFRNFYADMGSAPSPNYSLDRLDNDGDYEPSNCRWATAKEQAVNRKTTIIVNGLCLKDYCKSINLNYQTVATRLHRGWTLNDALHIPVRKQSIWKQKI
jgi:hypothetical protein